MKILLQQSFGTIVILLLSFGLFTSCARRAAFESSVIVPAANGKVKVKKNSNNNYSIDIDVEDLTTPGNLQPPKKVYIVWSEADNGTFSLGQLVTSKSFFHRGYTASLTTTSPSKPERIFITAEDNANTLAPGPQRILTTPAF